MYFKPIEIQNYQLLLRGRFTLRGLTFRRKPSICGDHIFIWFIITHTNSITFDHFKVAFFKNVTKRSATI